MKTTIHELLEKNAVLKEETIYFLEKDEINHFPMTAGDFFQIESKDKWKKESWVENLFQKKLQIKEQDPAYQELLHGVKKIKELIGRIKNADPKGYGHMAQLRSLRFAKKSMEHAMEELRLTYQWEINQEMEQAYGIWDRKLFVYKNTVCLGSFEDLVRQVPAFHKVEHNWIRKTPLLLRNIRAIQEAVANKIPMGLVGGPCLFGLYEVEILVQHKDGSRFSYDFSSGHYYDKADQKTFGFADHIRQYPDNIESIHFITRKKGITSQEEDSLAILFDVGAALGAKVAVIIPDISYLKYLSSVIAPLDPAMKEQTIREFRTEAHKIADMYLNRVEELKKQYEDVEVFVLHDRNEEACRIFHQSREAYFQNSGLIRRMTAKREKADAVFDYISMLAFPYYLWKTPQVIQVDNLDETDSYRKCSKVHKEAFSLSAILYSDKLSKNGEQTIFNAPLQYKGYV
ncbi:MAG: hypothetical protein J1E61_08255 [Lachnospiraceae bacterium]|nr:hypothetical protein [Lachnospiraceae bacterium]